MKIATFNINNINGRLDNLLAWLNATRPDVVCLQELKATDAQFPAAALNSAGYAFASVGQATWNGVAILSRVGDPVVTRRTLPGDTSERQARYIEAAVGGILVGCLYAPNGNPQPGPKFDYKLSWHDRMTVYGQDLIKSKLPIVLAGDYNIVPEPRDIYSTTSYNDNALVQPIARERFMALLDQGWTDALRKTYPREATLYTFWDYRRKRWERDAGLRLDHVLLSKALKPRLRGAGIDRSVRAKPNASDHAPVWVELD